MAGGSDYPPTLKEHVAQAKYSDDATKVQPGRGTNLPWETRMIVKRTMGSLGKKDLHIPVSS
jgi:hypothetical protein